MQIPLFYIFYVKETLGGNAQWAWIGVSCSHISLQVFRAIRRCLKPWNHLRFSLHFTVRDSIIESRGSQLMVLGRVAVVKILKHWCQDSVSFEFNILSEHEALKYPSCWKKLIAIYVASSSYMQVFTFWLNHTCWLWLLK